MRKTLLLGCIAVLTLGACTGESNFPVATGEGVVRAINTIPTSPTYGFLIEERTIGAAAYASVTNQTSWDDFPYTFNFDVVLPDSPLIQRVASSTIQVEDEGEYTFLITGEVAAPTIIVWEGVIRDWQDTETTFQTRFAHTAQSLGPIDVYFAAPGIAPALGEQVATLSFGELQPPVDYELGEYVYIVTTAGDPNDVLFMAETLAPAAQVGFIMSVFDGTANDLGPLAGRLITDGGISTSLVDVGYLPTIRFFHASAALDPSDIYTDELLTDLIVTNHSFREVTGDIDIAPDTYPFTYTSVGNVGSILYEGSAVIFPTSHYQFYVRGPEGAQNSFVWVPNRRSVETQVKLSFIHTAINNPIVDFYIVEAGASILDAFPLFTNVNPGTQPLDSIIRESELEFYLTVAGEKTIVAGPVPLTTNYGDVLEFVSYDNVDPATTDLILVPLP